MAALLALSGLALAQEPIWLAQAGTRATPKRMVARVWQARTLASRAEEFEKYLNASVAVRTVAAQGNLGIEILRRTDGSQAEFVVLSYWTSIDSARQFAAADERALNRDREFLVGFEPVIAYFEVARGAAR